MLQLLSHKVLLLQFKNLMQVKLMEPFICIVDEELFEAIRLQHLEAIDVEEAKGEQVCRLAFGTGRAVDLVYYPLE